MLDLKLELYTSAGTLVAAADSSTLGETITTAVAAGAYRLVVASHGTYGDIGQYAVSGTIIPAVNYVPAPSSLSAGVISASQVNLAWTDNSSNETAFAIQRSTDGGGDLERPGQRRREHHGLFRHADSGRRDLRVPNLRDRAGGQFRLLESGERHAGAGGPGHSDGHGRLQQPDQPELERRAG